MLRPFGAFCLSSVCSASLCTWTSRPACLGRRLWHLFAIDLVQSDFASSPLTSRTREGTFLLKRGTCRHQSPPSPISLGQLGGGLGGSRTPFTLVRIVLNGVSLTTRTRPAFRLFLRIYLPLKRTHRTNEMPIQRKHAVAIFRDCERKGIRFVDFG